MRTNRDLISIEEAAESASILAKKHIGLSNISYLVQYGRLEKHYFNGKTFVDKNELKNYYNKDVASKENTWKEKLGKDLNWSLSFSNFREKETTKHVHRLHPYKGKFIPQLVEYFLDSKIDSFKKKPYFKKGDIIIDPFCGSGTTLTQANELGIHCVGIDVSTFNTYISNIKIKIHDIHMLKATLGELTNNLINFNKSKRLKLFSEELSRKLIQFNKEYFPSPKFKRDIVLKKIDDKIYGEEKVRIFLKLYNKILNRHNVKLDQGVVSGNFLDTWFLLPIRNEIDFMLSQLDKIKDDNVKKLVMVILSRTIRSCRATTHSDLGTLKYRINKPYYCKKHAKICTPILTIVKRWKQYCRDTINRLEQFEKIKTNTYQVALSGDSRNIDILKALKNKDYSFYKILRDRKAQGIFTSPPYVGLIDYHKQHVYSYDLFNIERRDDLEIGPLFKGVGNEARELYIDAISKVFINCRKYMADNFNVLIVANDKYDLYPKIAKRAGFRIVQKYKRPVLNRVEKDRSPYSEIIFHMKSI